MTIRDPTTRDERVRSIFATLLDGLERKVKVDYHDLDDESNRTKLGQDCEQVVVSLVSLETAETDEDFKERFEHLSSRLFTGEIISETKPTGSAYNYYMKLAVGGAIGAALAKPLLISTLGAVGFTKAGVALSSWGAGIQGPATIAKGCFALCQSAGATGMLSKSSMVGLYLLGGTAGVVATSQGTQQWATTQKKILLDVSEQARLSGDDEMCWVSDTLLKGSTAEFYKCLQDCSSTRKKRMSLVAIGFHGANAEFVHLPKFMSFL